LASSKAKAASDAAKEDSKAAAKAYFATEDELQARYDAANPKPSKPKPDELKPKPKPAEGEGEEDLPKETSPETEDWMRKLVGTPSLLLVV
jgi:hypothetical protein